MYITLNHCSLWFNWMKLVLKGEFTFFDCIYNIKASFSMDESLDFDESFSAKSPESQEDVS